MNKNKLIVYTTVSCVYCTLLKKYLKNNDIEYIEKDITKDKELQEYIIKKTEAISVPVLQLGEKFVKGFNKKEIEKLIHDEK